MALQVHALCAHLTRMVDDPRAEDFSAQKLVRAIKGEPFKGWGTIPIHGRQMRLDEESAGSAPAWVASWAAQLVKDAGEETVFVPVPRAGAIHLADDAGPPARIAENLARLVDGTVGDTLRWRQPLPSTRAGGTRDARVLLANLLVHEPWLIAGKLCVVVDDVVTLGGHLQAAKAALSAQGARVWIAVCAAQTVLEQVPDPFRMAPIELPDI